MTIPNLGVTQVIQQPGLGGVLGQSLGGISNMLMQLEQFRMQQARDNTNQAFMGEQTTTMRTNREQAKRDREAAAQQAQQQAAAYEQLLQLPQVAKRLQPGVLSSLRLMPPSEGVAKLQELLSPQTVAGDARLVAPGEGGAPNVILGPDQTPKPTGRTGDVAEALEVALGLPRDTPVEQLDETQRGVLDRYINRKVATGASRNTTEIYGNTAASESARGVIAGLMTEVDDAVTGRGEVAAIDRMLTTLDAPGGILAGPVSGRLVGLGLALKDLGLIDNPSPENARIYMMQGADRVLPIVRKLAPVTKEDLAYLTMTKAGRIDDLPPEGLRRVLQLQREAEVYRVREARRRVTESRTIPEDARADLLNRIGDVSDLAPRSQQFEVQNARGQKVIVTGTLDPATGRYIGTVDGRRGYLN